MPATLTKLTQHLAQEVQLMRDFIAILDAEDQALAQHKISALTETTARKVAHTEKLQAAATMRATHLAALGFPDDPQDLSALVQHYPQMRPAVDHLVQLTTDARTRNANNGITIQTYQHQHQSARQQLQALCVPQALYDARGRTQSTLMGAKHIRAG